MNVSEILNKAADLIEPEGAWTQGAYGRDATGETVPNYAPGCVCRCLSGAIWTTAGERPGVVPDPIVHVAHQRVSDHLGIGRSIANWNDAPGRTQAEAVAALRAAAEKAAQ